jgi:hypothetical protein
MGKTIFNLLNYLFIMFLSVMNTCAAANRQQVCPRMKNKKQTPPHFEKSIKEGIKNNDLEFY